ncbi:hypothetical protein KIN20_003341 [Parelaphostrongylus tenuis]|uniref:DUF4139 domain-containing protein n=1 Tax=Parelaphostrongylus tenuis TaxID=148309 RepID=A0AAD5LZ04_PARTN|nr:hypothetical protein KIN20_003341 [Parelaphostrongylus tenuis]
MDVAKTSLLTQYFAEEVLLYAFFGSKKQWHQEALSKAQRQLQALAAHRKPIYAGSEEDMGFGSFDCNDVTDAIALHRYNTIQQSRTSEESSIATHSIENLVSMCFPVPRMISIPSNGLKYKVLIATFDLACIFVHECVPSRCDSAFLSAIVTNTTSFPLSPGPLAVYLNNGFITKFHLGVVLPGEHFRCSLGVDSSIKVECKTPNISKTQVGFMSKNTLITHEQIVSLRNSKVSETVQLTVWEQIPKSVDEKIKVCVISPDIRGKSEAILNNDHNLEWKFVLASGEHRDLYIKYTVEHPVSESISYKPLCQH